MRLERSLLTTLFVAVAVSAMPAAAQRTDVPVQLGGDRELDACGSVGVVVGLDPKGDNFLSVRSGPGGKPHREVDRLHSGNQIWMCESRGAWQGVVYAPRARKVDCGVGEPRPKRAEYHGPCKSGWVHRRFIRIVAG